MRKTQMWETLWALLAFPTTFILLKFVQRSLSSSQIVELDLTTRSSSNLCFFNSVIILGEFSTDFLHIYLAGLNIIQPSYLTCISQFRPPNLEPPRIST